MPTCSTSNPRSAILNFSTGYGTSPAFKQRRAADSARWRERLHRGAAVYPVEVDGELFDLMERFGGVIFEVQ